MTVLVTGSSGYIGEHVIAALSKRTKCLGLDISKSDSETTLKGDIRDANAIRQIIAKNEISTIIHLAALKDVTESNIKQNSYTETNLFATAKIAEIARDANIKNFIFASSAAVYGDTESDSPIKENSILKPSSHYGITKMQAEIALKEILKDSVVNLSVVRIFNVIGASLSSNNNGNGLPEIIISRLRNPDKILDVYKASVNTYDGSCVRDYIDVRKIADVIALLALNNCYQLPYATLNLSEGKGLSVLELIDKFSQFANAEIPWQWKPAREGEISVSIGDNSSIRKFIGSLKEYPIEKSVLSYFRLKSDDC